MRLAIGPEWRIRDPACIGVKRARLEAAGKHSRPPAIDVWGVNAAGQTFERPANAGAGFCISGPFAVDTKLSKHGVIICHGS